MTDFNTKKHSFAHLMAAAVGKMFPEAQYGVGPVIENGCYYDFVLPRPLVPEDLDLLDGHLREMLKSHLSFKYQEYSIEDAIIHFEKANQPFKVELLENLRDKGTTSMSDEEKLDFEQDKIQISNGNAQDIVQVVKNKKQGWIDVALPDMGVSESILDDNWIKSNEESYLSKKFIVAKNKEGQVLGSAVYGDDGEIHEVFVAKETRGLGVGKKLMQFIIPNIFKNNGEVKLGCIVSNTNALKFYEKLGFDIVGEREIFVQLEPEGKTYNLFEKIMILPEAEIAKFERGLSKITLYRITDEKTGEIIFEDLCRGPHIEHVKEIKNIGFKLDKFSASYWRGDQSRGVNMQRLYALVFETKDELKEFEAQRTLAQERDHRKLGKELEIFMISEDVGAGLPLYLPNGATIRQLLEKYCYQEAKKAGYQYVYTPHIGKSDLFAKSGHLDHYSDGMFAPMDMVNLKGEGVIAGQKVEKFYLKPMNCPMHHQIYLNRPKSYRDLPYRLYEYGTVYRYEESGSLSGMIRVRGFTQNDAHVYCQRNQLKQVISEALARFLKAYKDIGITDYKIRFSLPDFVNDSEKYGEETQEWIDSVSSMRSVLDELEVDYYDAIGEAAFYGPKIDIQVKNVNGKEDSLSTIQVDYSIAPKFGITYKNSDGMDETPTIIHMALMGSVDRFMAFMIEMTGGKLPLWVAPTQVKILTINDQVLDYVEQIKVVLNDTVLMKPLKYNEIRYKVDSRSESLNKKIRDARLEKIPMLMVIGQKDVDANQVSIEYNGQSTKVSLSDLKSWIENIN